MFGGVQWWGRPYNTPKEFKNLSQTVHSGVFGPKELIGGDPAWNGLEESCQVRKGKPAVCT